MIGRSVPAQPPWLLARVTITSGQTLRERNLVILRGGAINVHYYFYYYYYYYSDWAFSGAPGKRMWICTFTYHTQMRNTHSVQLKHYAVTNQLHDSLKANCVHYNYSKAYTQAVYCRCMMLEMARIRDRKTAQGTDACYMIQRPIQLCLANWKQTKNEGGGGGGRERECAINSSSP